jgi:hypothetical protein
MKIKRSLIAASLAALLSFAGAAHADDAPATAPKKEPQAPKHVVLVPDRIDEWIGTDRVADYAIGDPMVVTLMFDITPDSMYRAAHPNVPPQMVLPPSPVPAGPSTAPAANVAKVQMPKMLEWPVIEVEGLKMAALSGKTTEAPSDVEVYKGASIKTYQMPDGRRRMVVTMTLTQYVTTQKEADGKTTKTQADAALDFAYATSQELDGQPEWHSATTPLLTFGIHQSADPNQTQLIEGDLSDKTSPRAQVMYWAFGLAVLFGIIPLWEVVRAIIGRTGRQRELTRNERTWRKLGEVFKEANAAGEFKIGHYQHVFHLLREYLGIYSITTTQALEKVATGVDGNGKPIDVDAAKYLFHEETVLFDPNKVIDADDRSELFRNIAVLVPIEDEQLKKYLALAGDLIPRQ